MSFSTKTEYGLVALIELAEMYPGGGVVQAGEIARRQGIPERYLEQMLTSLRRSGLVNSLRGPRGGYQLARSPELITVAEVLACLEGKAGGASPDGKRSTTAFLVLTALEQKLEQARARVLAALTLKQLLDDCRARSQPTLMYHI